jgi:hypothetical protein
MITERAMLAAVHISVWTAVKHDRKVSRDVANTDDPAKRTTIVDQIGETEGRLPAEFLEGKTAIDLVSLTRLQADLGPQQVLVEYVLDDPRSYALGITRTAVNRYVLPPKQTLEQEARDYRSTVTQRKPDAATGQKLFQQLLGNIPAYKRNAEVILVPDGELHLLPFSALIGGPRYVIESHQETNNLRCSSASLCLFDKSASNFIAEPRATCRNRPICYRGR